MGFAGNLQTLSLAEVIQTLHRIKADGVLRLASSDGTCEVVFAAGDIAGVEAHFADGRDEVARRLRALGRLAGDDQTTAQAVISGSISQQEVDDIAAQVALEELYDLTTWQQADFVFHESTEGPEVAATVERHRSHPIGVSVDAVLLEAARRQDEWQLLREAFRGEEVVRMVPGREAEVDLQRGESITQLVLPCIDGVRAVDDLLRDSTATRFDLYRFLAGLQDRGLVAVLEPEELAAEAARLAEAGEHAQAALLLRRLLAHRAEDAEAATALAAALEQAAEFPGAAGCWSQLALARLTGGQTADALPAAQRAVQLDPRDPALRLVAVRCLIAAGQADGALEELRTLGRMYVELGRIEEARDTSLKVLAMRPEDEEARRELVRIHALSATEPGSEDVVVCAQCSTVNPREGTVCTKCNARLHLSCLSCGRIVSVSDRICVFCGAEPHAPPKGSTSRARALAQAGPSTDRILAGNRRGGTGKIGTDEWRRDVTAHVRAARAHEAAQRYEEALAEWKQVAQMQAMNAALAGHIRDLESLCHDRFIESRIARGHDLRRRRRYWRALRAYRAAMRGLSPQDPRVPRLQELSAATTRSHRRVMVIYAAAGLILAAAGALAAKPYVELRAHLRRCDELAALATPGRPLAELAMARDECAQMAERAGRLPGALRQRALDRLNGPDEVGDRLAAALRHAGGQLRTQIAAAIARGDAAAARAGIAEHRRLLGAVPELVAFESQAQALAVREADTAAAVAKAMETLAAAKAAEESGRVGAALAAYRALAQLPQGAYTAPARAGIDRLAAGESGFDERFAQAQALAGSDLARADERLAALAEEAPRWERTAPVAAALAAVRERLAAARAAWEALGPDAGEAELDAFVAAHRAAPQAALALARLADLRLAARTSAETRRQIAEAMERKEYELAHRLVLALAKQRAGHLRPGEVALPLLVESEPAGARVRVDGVEKGGTPLLLTIDPAAPPREIDLHLSGWRPVAAPAATVAASWRWRQVLDRDALWSVQTARMPSALAACADGGVAILAAQELVRLAEDGGIRWRCRLPTDDEGLGGGHAVAWSPLEIDGGRMLAPTATGLAVIAPDGTILGSFATDAPVMPRPLIFASDLLGGRARLAFAADGLWVGDLAGQPARIDLGEPLLSGPATVADGMSRLLVVADLRGRLLAVDEATQRPAWAADLRASEVGQLVAIRPGTLAAVLDGARLGCWAIDGAGARELWQFPLGSAAVGQPVAEADGTVALASAAQVLRVGGDGRPSTPIALPSPATAIAGGRGLLAIGCRGHVVLASAGRIRWSTPVPSPAVAVAVAGSRVVAVLADGTVAAYPE